MDAHRTGIDDTPLLVNFLRLIRNGRTAPFTPLEMVSFHFGGLRMEDGGPYNEAEEMWLRYSALSAPRRDPLSPSGCTFTGPLHLAVTLDDVLVEVWTLEDYRDGHTEHTVPRNYEQLAEINTLVRVLYSYLRVQDVYRVITQHCGHHASALSDPTSSVQYYKLRLQVYAETEHGPNIENPQYQLWSFPDLMRVSVRTNALWFSDLRRRESSTILPLTSPISQTETPDRTQPITEVANTLPSTSREMALSVSNKSIPTPYLAPSSPSNKQSLHSTPPLGMSRGADYTAPPAFMLSGVAHTLSVASMAGSQLQCTSGQKKEYPPVLFDLEDSAEGGSEKGRLRIPPHVLQMSHVFPYATESSPDLCRSRRGVPQALVKLSSPIALSMDGERADVEGNGAAAGGKSLAQVSAAGILELIHDMSNMTDEML